MRLNFAKKKKIKKSQITQITKLKQHHHHRHFYFCENLQNSVSDYLFSTCVKSFEKLKFFTS